MDRTIHKNHENWYSTKIKSSTVHVTYYIISLLTNHALKSILIYNIYHTCIIHVTPVLSWCCRPLCHFQPGTVSKQFAYSSQGSVTYVLYSLDVVIPLCHFQPGTVSEPLCAFLPGIYYLRLVLFWCSRPPLPFSATDSQRTTLRVPPRDRHFPPSPTKYRHSRNTSPCHLQLKVGKCIFQFLLKNLLNHCKGFIVRIYNLFFKGYII